MSDNDLFSHAIDSVPLAEVLPSDAHPDFLALFPEDAKLCRLADGFTWTEGPVWVPARGAFMFSDVRQNKTWWWNAEDGLSLADAPSHHQNGHCLDEAERVIACSHGLRALMRRGHDGLWTILADSWQGRRLNSPNDVALHPDGSLWFTDPTYGIDKADEGYGGEMEQSGRWVYRWSEQDGLSREIFDCHKPNGLAFIDAEHLLIADTGDDAATHLYRIQDGKVIHDKTAFVVSEGKTDGLRVDAEGRVWSSSRAGVEVFSSLEEGFAPLGVLPLPITCANLCFGGERNDVLFMTVTDSIYAVQTKVRGQSWEQPLNGRVAAELGQLFN